MPLLFQFPESPFQPLVETIQMGLCLRDQPVESLDGLPLDLTVQEVSKLTLLSVDERVQGYLDMPANRCILSFPLLGNLP